MLKIFFVFLICSLQAFGQVKTYQLKCEGLGKQFKYKTDFPDSLAVIAEVNQLLTEAQFTGYFYAEVKSSSWDKTELNVLFDLGPRFTTTSLTNGNIQTPVLSEIRFKEKYYQNQLWDLIELNKLKQDLLSWYENNGYPFAKVWLDDITITNQAISSKLYSDPGKNIEIDTLRMIGSAKISQKYMQSYLGIRNGEAYNEEKVLQIDKKLQELSFVSQPKKVEVVFIGDKAKINLFLDKQNANQFDGLLGFLPAADGKLQIIGDFKLKLQNAFKRAETIDFNYRGLPAQSQELNMKLSYPYIFNTPLGINTDFQFYKRDTSFLNLNARFSFAYSFSSDRNLGFFVETFTGNQLGAVEGVSTNTSTFGNVNTIFYGLESQLLKLDSRIIPQKGYNINLSFGVGKRTIKNGNATNNQKNGSQYKILGDFNYYLSLSKLANIYLHNQVAFLSGKALYDNEAFRIGGLKTFRGFDEQSILANSYSIQTIELRYFLERRSFLSIFYDQGIVNKDFLTGSYLDYPLGLGAGLTFQTKVGLLSLSSAVGKQRNNPLDLQKAKVHFGIVSYF